MKNNILIFLLPVIAVAFNGCNSSSDSSTESSSNSSSSADDTTSTSAVGKPEVKSVRPAENSFLISVETSVSVTFSTKMDAGSINVNTSGSACSGSLQLSEDNFTSCIRMSGTPSESEENHTFTAKPADNLSYGTNYRIRVLNTVSDTSGNTPESTYTSVKGFTTVPLRTTSDQTTIACRTRPLKATPTVYTIDLSVDSASDYTGLDVYWFPVSGASSYGVEIKLLSFKKFIADSLSSICLLYTSPSPRDRG